MLSLKILLSLPQEPTHDPKHAHARAYDRDHDRGFDCVTFLTSSRGAQAHPQEYAWDHTLPDGEPVSERDTDID